MIKFDNSIQINIKFTFTVHVYIIVYEYIWIYSIIQFNIYIYYIYIWTLCFFVYCNIVATHTYDGHTGFTFIWSFPAGFTSRNGLHNCEPTQKPFLFFEVKFWQVSNIFHFKLIHPCIWINVILASHYLPVQTQQ